MFMGPIPKGMQIDHIDNDKTNDALSNLQLLTASQNSVKARANSRADYGTKTVIMVDKDGHTVAEFKSARQAERDTQDTIKAAHRRISECCHGLLALHRGFR